MGMVADPSFQCPTPGVKPNRWLVKPESSARFTPQALVECGKKERETILIGETKAKFSLSSTRGGSSREPDLGRASRCGNGAAKAEGVRLFAHRGNAETDVFFQRGAEFFGPFADIVAVDAAREGLVL